jgi:hypothetical protein
MQFAALLEEDEDKPGPAHTRARFIHLQLAQARLSPSDPQWMRLNLEAESLLLDHKREWTPTWYGEAGIRNAEFHRGFIEAITISETNLTDYSERIFAQSPIRHLDIVELLDPVILGPILVLLDRGRYLDRMVSLRIDGQNLRDEHVEYLNRPSLSGLRWLSLANNHISREGALTLTQRHLARLAFVDLDGNPFDPVERLTFDQGIVVDRSSAHVPEDFPKVPWLGRRVVSGLLFQPSRFETVRGLPKTTPREESDNLRAAWTTRAGRAAARKTLPVDKVGVG